jgi:hypothetical protein
MSECSLVSARQATALEVCALVYGDTEIPEVDVVERIYEATAGVHLSFTFELVWCSDCNLSLQCEFERFNLFCVILNSAPLAMRTHW